MDERRENDSDGAASGGYGGPKQLVIRPDMVTVAQKFMMTPQVCWTSLEQQNNFLLQKGLTQGEIDEARRSVQVVLNLDFISNICENTRLGCRCILQLQPSFPNENSEAFGIVELNNGERSAAGKFYIGKLDSRAINDLFGYFLRYYLVTRQGRGSDAQDCKMRRDRCNGTASIDDSLAVNDPTTSLSSPQPSSSWMRFAKCALMFTGLSYASWQFLQKFILPRCFGVRERSDDQMLLLQAKV
ncbi:unnamed protein product [Gongylonema pulchrum]|uniref:Pex14_N domain-containing protein n=1 Tax=Gongylonema pulchrum TaxID=637853 RepID=A0A183DPV5_9BILA|nr:unnamed protein product [Gongylonema pulchrum]